MNQLRYGEKAMNAHKLISTPNTLAPPMAVADLIVLAKQIRAEFASIRGHMDGILHSVNGKKAA